MFTTLQRKVLGILLIGTFQYLIDYNHNKCYDPSATLNINNRKLLQLHHIINMYILIGGFLFNPLYHLIFIVLTMLHWITNNNKCFLTEIVNKNCNWSEDKEFYDFIEMSGINKLVPNTDWYVLLSLAIYDIYKIYE